MDYVILGRILQEARNKTGLKQSEVATEVNCTPANISSWERGKSKIDIDSFAKLCEIYNIDFASTLKQAANSSEFKTKNSENLDINREKLIQNYDRMNKKGKKRLLEYSEDLVNSGNYQDEYTEKQKHA